jgi:hypothetical protein
MKGRIICLFLGTIACNAYGANILDLDVALQNTYRACVNIDDNLHDLKVLAGVNTAVTAVGAGLGAGALAVGLTKAQLDKKIEELYGEMTDLVYDYQGDPSTPEEENAFVEGVQKSTSGGIGQITEEQQKIADDLMKSDIDQGDANKDNKDIMVAKSKKLGNWRTGLLAGNTATNIAGAVIASKTINKNDVTAQINDCITATQDLKNAILSAKIGGADTSEASQIYDACSEYEYVDVDAIAKSGKGSMISSSIGAGLGGIGTITSATANSKKVRDDNTKSGKDKEKNLNTASNVLSAGATVASVTATVFNAKQVSAIKKAAEVSQKCTGLLR